MPDLDTLLVAVGGGGLIGGIAAYCAGSIRIIGVEPENAPSLTRALAAGAPVDVPVSGIAADSLGARRIGALCFAQRHNIGGAVLVSDEAIASAQQTIWDVLRVVAEPGGAVHVPSHIVAAIIDPQNPIMEASSKRMRRLA